MSTHTHRIHIKFYQPNTRRKVAKYKFLCGYYTEFITHSTHTQRIRQLEKHINIYRERGGAGEGKGESYQMVCAGSRLSLDWRLWVVLWNSWRNPFVKISYSFLILSVKKTTFSQLKHVATNPYHPFSSLFFSYSRIHHTHACVQLNCSKLEEDTLWEGRVISSYKVFLGPYLTGPEFIPTFILEAHITILLNWVLEFGGSRNCGT